LQKLGGNYYLFCGDINKPFFFHCLVRELLLDLAILKNKLSHGCGIENRWYVLM